MSAPPQYAMQTETEELLRFEMLLADVCAQFVNVAASDVDSKIANAQRAICESLRIDHSSVWQVSEENPDKPVMTHVYRDPNLRPLPLRPSVKECFPWSSSKILNKEIVCVPNTATLSPEAATDKESWEEYGIQSSLVIPLSVGGGSVIGVLAFDSEKEHDWPDPLQRRLQILAHVFAQALERKHAEQNRKMAEDRLREYETAVEGLEEMIVVVDRQYRYLIANRKFLNLRRMTKGQVEGRFANEVLNKVVFEAVIKEKLDECFRGNVVRFEMKYTYPELGERDVSVSYFPMAGKTGVDRVACIFQDITERKRAEEGLRELNHTLEGQAALLQSREELLKTFVKNVPAAVAMLDREMCYLQVSDRWCTDYLSGREQIIGRSHYEIFPDMPERWKEVHRRGLQGETLRADEDRWDGQDGPHWARWEVRPWKTPEGTVGGILILAEDITRRKQMEEVLRESEDKLRLILDSTAEAVYGIDLEHRCTFCNPACLHTLGYERVDEVLGKNTHNLIHHTRADGTRFPVEECRVHRVTRTGEGVHAEDEVFWRANGTSFPAECWSYPQRKGEEVVGAVVAFIDITERKLAEAALANVSRKLIEAQEQERSRIGRELHDDIGQRLALLAIELQQLHGDPLVLPEVRSRIGELQKQTSEIAADIQSLSHELHSAKLQYLGIAAAMRGFCRDFGEQHKVEIDFQIHDLPSPVPPDTALCFFRVLQEALHNSAKHSGVRYFEVRLWGTSDEIHLTVTDSGVGLDREAAKTSQGLGLISMEERLKLVNGTLSIESQPKRGTTIHARVPIVSGSDSMRATG